MTTDLENLLRQADEAVAAPPPRVAATLGQAVGQRVRQRRKLRRVSATAALALLILASVGFWARLNPVNPVATPPVALRPPVAVPPSNEATPSSSG